MVPVVSWWTTREKAKELSADPKMEIRVVSFGLARTKKVPMAAARSLLPRRRPWTTPGSRPPTSAPSKTYNPFAANDIDMAKAMGLDVNAMSNFRLLPRSSAIPRRPLGPV